MCCDIHIIENKELLILYTDILRQLIIPIGK
jgi:hypothetical protein